MISTVFVNILSLGERAEGYESFSQTGDDIWQKLLSVISAQVPKTYNMAIRVDITKLRKKRNHSMRPRHSYSVPLLDCMVPI